VLKIYHIELRRSERVVWLMEELGLPYELIYTRGDIVGSALAIKAVHPIGAAPRAFPAANIRPGGRLPPSMKLI
jgi:glutathione S-transferase